MNTEIQTRRQFASDNYAGICPEAFAALSEANRSHATSYGDDPWTQRAADMIREVFETDCQVFFVFNGTAANSLALASLCQSYHSILCHEHAHIETAECGAPEFFANGTKVLLMPGADGKIDPNAIEGMVKRRTDIHYPKPRAMSLTQATEMGTVYSAAELQTLIGKARELKLRVQMDGARFANAVVATGAKPKELTWQAGVDVLCFGGTKNGMAVGEAVVFFDKELAEDFDRRCKQAGQLASKMRFVSASWLGMLENDAWLRHARHANEMAKRLEAGVRALPQLKISYPCQTNGVFVKMPPSVIKGMHALGWMFYTHVSPEDCRLMCSWDTTAGDVDAFVKDLKKLVSV